MQKQEEKESLRYLLRADGEIVNYISSETQESREKRKDQVHFAPLAGSEEEVREH